MPKPGFGFKNEDFFFSGREKRLFIMAASVGAGVIVLCLFAIAAVSIAKGAFRPAAAAPVEMPAVSSARPATAAPPEPAVTFTDIGDIHKPMSLSSFVIPDETQRLLEPEYTILRPRTGVWDRKMVEQFWVPPSQIGLENLRKLNDKNIEDLFEGVQ